MPTPIPSVRRLIVLRLIAGAILAGILAGVVVAVDALNSRTHNIVGGVLIAGLVINYVIGAVKAARAEREALIDATYHGKAAA